MKNAGFTIIKTAYTGKRDDGALFGVALGYRTAPYIGEEYVTWAFTEEEGKELSFYWGHYFSGLNAELNADRDFLKRRMK